MRQPDDGQMSDVVERPPRNLRVVRLEGRVLPLDATVHHDGPRGDGDGGHSADRHQHADQLAVASDEDDRAREDDRGQGDLDGWPRVRHVTSLRAALRPHLAQRYQREQPERPPRPVAGPGYGTVTTTLPRTLSFPRRARAAAVSVKGSTLPTTGRMTPASTRAAISAS